MYVNLIILEVKNNEYFHLYLLYIYKYKTSHKL